MNDTFKMFNPSNKIVQMSEALKDNIFIMFKWFKNSLNIEISILQINIHRGKIYNSPGYCYV